MSIKVILLILILTLSPFFLFLFHLLSIKFFKLIGKDIPMQKLITYCIIFFNIPMLISIYFILNKDFGVLEIIYSMIVFNSFSYFYFHFFNMSETARRIKMLINIRNNNIKNISDLNKYYTPEKALLVRLERLCELNQIEKTEQGLKLKKKLLYHVSLLVYVFRVILGFERKNEGK